MGDQLAGGGPVPTGAADTAPVTRTALLDLTARFGFASVQASRPAAAGAVGAACRPLQLRDSRGLAVRMTRVMAVIRTCRLTLALVGHVARRDERHVRGYLHHETQAPS